jgi:ABC-type lipoprotein release transport system permease subunit
MARWIEKQRNIIDFTLSALLRRKGKNISLLVVYTIIVFTLASAIFFTHAMKQEASLILHGTPEMVVQHLMAGRQDLMPPSYGSVISGIRGVAGVEGRLWGYYYDPVIGANYTLMVPRQSPPPEGSIVIGKGLSRQRQIYEGDMLSFRAHDGRPRSFVVRAILTPESELVSADLILMSEKSFRDFFGLSRPYVTDLAVSVKNPQELATIARKISELLPETRPVIRDEMAHTYDAVFDWRGGIVIVLFMTSLLAFAILAWDKASGISAEERREIGILKAIGWETSDVILMKVWEGLVVSLLSFLSGILLAWLHIFSGKSFLFAQALKGWSTLYPVFRLAPFVSPAQVALLFFLTVVPYTVATMLPSWKSAIVDPDAVMRS